MSNQFPPDADDQIPEEKSSQQLLLLLLLLLVVLFAYLYFFTGLLRHREDRPKPQPVAEVLLKKHLPPRSGGTNPAGQAPPSPQATSVPTEAPTGNRVKPAKPAAALRPEPKPLPVSVPKKPAPEPAVQAKVLQKQAAAEKSMAPRLKKPKSSAPPPVYTLEIEGDLLESEMGPVMAKLKRSGITRVVKTATHKGEPMHRLFLADFASHDEAAEELERLKQAAPAAFMLKENGRYAVYAGSYLREGKAANERDRLSGRGVQLLLKSVTAPVAVLKVRAGSFTARVRADAAAKELKKAGLGAKVVRNIGGKK